MIAVADSFDAMTTDRPYRARLPLLRVLRELEDKADSQIDAAADGSRRRDILVYIDRVLGRSV